MSLLVLIYLIRIFAVDQFPVNTYSMSPTISAGDKIVVNKLIFGARLYKSFDFKNGSPLKSFRIKGFRKIKHNDIIVFNFPYDNKWHKIQFKINLVYTKRCIGLPGDIISVVNGYFLNNNYGDSLSLFTNQKYLSKIAIKDLPRGFSKPYPINSISNNWNIKDFGPIYIPKAGELILLSPINYELYKILIEYETGKVLSILNNKIYLGSVFIDHYKFKKNYYYVVGDNLLNSLDSRYFGFIPEEFIIGVVSRIKKNNSYFNSHPDDDQIRFE